MKEPQHQLTKIDPLAFLILCVLGDHEDDGGDGLTAEQITWNLENMPSDVAKDYLIRGLKSGRIEPNPLKWMRD